jgi:co-chaperonin GroES (HSP10)
LHRNKYPQGFRALHQTILLNTKAAEAKQPQEEKEAADGYILPKHPEEEKETADGYSPKHPEVEREAADGHFPEHPQEEKEAADGYILPNTSNKKKSTMSVAHLAAIAEHCPHRLCKESACFQVLAKLVLLTLQGNS